MTTIEEILRLGKAIILNRWMVLVASFMVMISAGGVYDFGIYSQSLKLSLGYSQETVNTVSFFKDVGTNVGVLSGLLYDWKGPPLVFLSGAVMNVVGYLMIWLAVTERIATPHVWHMYLYFVISSSWTAFINTACIATCIKNFPHSRGIVVGLLKGSLGLGGAILTIIFRAVYGNNTNSFILLLSWFPTAVCLLLMLIIRIVPTKHLKTDKRNFNLFLAMIVAMALYLMIAIIIQDICKVSKVVNQIFCVIMFLMLPFPLFVVFKDELTTQKPHGEATTLDHADFQAPRIVPISIGRTNSLEDVNDIEIASKSCQEPVHTTRDMDAKDLGENSCETITIMELKSSITSHLTDIPTIPIPCRVDTVSEQNEVSQRKHSRAFEIGSQSRREPFSSAGTKIGHGMIQSMINSCKASQKGKDLTPAQALCNVNLWLIFLSAVCGVGSQLMVIDNLGQIGTSLRYSQTKITTCISLVSIWNCFGRVGAGFISEYYVQKKAVSRPWFLALALAISSVGHMILAFNVPKALYVGSVIIGLCYGAQFTVIFTTISEISGLRFYATIMNIVQLSNPIGLYAMSVKTAGRLYDREARKQLGLHTTRHGSLTCTGVHCYNITFFIMTGISIIGSIFACILAIRTRWLYEQLHLQHLHHHNESHLDRITIPAEFKQGTSEEEELDQERSLEMHHSEICS